MNTNNIQEDPFRNNLCSRCRQKYDLSESTYICSDCCREFAREFTETEEKLGIIINSDILIPERLT